MEVGERAWREACGELTLVGLLPPLSVRKPSAARGGNPRVNEERGVWREVRANPNPNLNPPISEPGKEEAGASGWRAGSAAALREEAPRLRPG